MEMIIEIIVIILWVIGGLSVTNYYANKQGDTFRFAVAMCYYVGSLFLIMYLGYKG